MSSDIKWKLPLIIILVVIAVWVFLYKGINLGIDLKGGAEIIYKLGKEDLTQAQLDNTVNVLYKRIDPSFTKEIRIENIGGDRIRIQIPERNREQIDAIKNRLEQLGVLEFKIVVTDQSIVSQTIEGKKPPAGYEVFFKDKNNPDFSGKYSADWIIAKKTDPYNLTGEYLSSVVPATDEQGARAVGINFNAEGKNIFARLTGENVGEQLAIILDGNLASAPNINERIYGNAIISRPGGFSQDEFNNLRTVLEAGSLKTPLIYDSENFIGPTLGMDSIRKGVYSLIVGMIFVMVFMAIYYLAVGLVANFALMLNLIFIMGFMSLLEAALTLPGIAGIILTVGMAVDANVLIYERIREERAAGKALREAIDSGYRRAFWTIFDANLTTIITAVILYWIGTGPLKGFAIVLIFGIISSVFTALFVTRAIFNIFLRFNLMKKFKMLQIIKNPNIKFSRKSLLAISISAALIVLGVAVVFFRGEDILDTDFRGGTYLHLEFSKSVPTADVRSRFDDIGYGNVEVQALYGDQALIGATTSQQFGVRLLETDADKLKSEISDEFSDLMYKTRVNIANITDENDPYNNGVALNLTFDMPKEPALIEAFLDSSLFKEKEGGQSQQQFSNLTDPTVFVDGKEIDLNNPEISKETFKEITIKFKKAGPVSEDLLTKQISQFFSMSDSILSSETVSPTVAKEMQWRAFWAIAVAMIAIVLYIRLRFGNFGFGLAAVVALIHDVVISLGLLAIVGLIGKSGFDFLAAGDLKINLTVVGAFLTIIGYSLNDTIVVFDRIRENSEKHPGLDPQIIDSSVNQTLSRTLLTSGTTLIVVVVLYLFGGQRIHSFAFALLVGVIVGTYSSIFIASPILIIEKILGIKKKKPPKG